MILAILFGLFLIIVGLVLVGIGLLLFGGKLFNNPLATGILGFFLGRGSK